MLKILSVIKRLNRYRWWIGIALLVVLAGIAAAYQLEPQATPARSPIPTNKQAYPAVQVAKTSKDQLTQIIGKPYTSYSQGQWQIETVASSKSPYKPDRFYLKDGVVQIKEQWFEPTVSPYTESKLIAIYGKPAETAFDQTATDQPIKVDLYTAQGMAAYIYASSKLVSHIQWFAPMPEDKYVQLTGAKLGPRATVLYQPEPKQK